MPNKENITSKQLLELYTDFVLENGCKPASVYKFAKENSFDESLFYKHFSSFDALEESIFVAFFNNSIQLLEANQDYQNYDARHQLLSFYYTFFEVLTANRSYVMYALKQGKQPLKGIKNLSQLKQKFNQYIQSLGIETWNIENKQLQSVQDKTITESAWIQLLLTLKFWMDDTSASFQKTDIFIEKSINTSFDLINTQPLKSVIDFGKFVLKEKFQTT